MSFTISPKVRTYVVDLSERVASTFAESVLAGMTSSSLIGTVTGTPWPYILNTASFAALYALAKGVAGGFIPSGQDGQLSAGLLPLASKQGNDAADK